MTRWQKPKLRLSFEPRPGQILSRFIAMLCFWVKFSVSVKHTSTCSYLCATCKWNILLSVAFFFFTSDFFQCISPTHTDIQPLAPLRKVSADLFPVINSLHLCPDDVKKLTVSCKYHTSRKKWLGFCLKTWRSSCGVSHTLHHMKFRF